MTPTIQVLSSLALTFGAPLVIAGWELWHLGPTTWRPPPIDDIPPDPKPLPDRGQLPRTQKPLPDCLVPRSRPARQRELA